MCNTYLYRVIQVTVCIPFRNKEYTCVCVVHGCDEKRLCDVQLVNRLQTGIGPLYRVEISMNRDWQISWASEVDSSLSEVVIDLFFLNHREISGWVLQ